MNPENNAVLKSSRKGEYEQAELFQGSYRAHRLMRYLVFLLPVILVSVLVFTACREGEEDEDLIEFGMGHLLDNAELQAFGEKLFFDSNLSTPSGQACATCHGPEAGWSGPDSEINAKGAVYEGAVKGRFSDRKPPSAAYATYSPVFNAMLEEGELLFVGGNFWDGRATGYLLGNAAADQAQQPFLNPVEQNISDEKEVVKKVLQSDYSDLYHKIAADIWNIDNISACEDLNMQFGIIGLALAAFEHSDKVNAFTSKYDYYLRGKVRLTPQEEKGMDLFRNKGLCAECHPMDVLEDGTPPLFTDFTYDNLGMPANPDNPWYTMDKSFNSEGSEYRDPGLGGFLKQLPHYAMFAEESLGMHRVPTLRNVDKRPSPDFVKSYGHNGYFKSLEEIVHFYNTRDVLPLAGEVDDPRPGINCWPEPEIAQNINLDELGDLELTDEEEDAIVAFMKTLSDGYELPDN